MGVKVKRYDKKSIKKEMERGGSGNWPVRVKDGEILTVSFLTDPEDWLSYQLYYSNVPNVPPVVITEENEHLYVGKTLSTTYLAPVVLVDDKSSRAIQMGKMLVKALLHKQSRNGTLIGLVFELSREGTGFDTVYYVDRVDEQQFDVEPVDLVKQLEQIADGGNERETAREADIEDDEEEDEPRRPAKRKKVVRRR